MLIIGLILILIAFIIVVIDFIVEDDNRRAGPLVLFIALIGSALLSTGIIQKTLSKYPQAIDVYRGNTTLQITYKDSIPVDTVVVFK